MKTPSTASSEHGYWVPGPDVFVPFEYVYYWHPDSDSLLKTTVRDPDPTLVELQEHEYIILNLDFLDREARNLIVATEIEELI